MSVIITLSVLPCFLSIPSSVGGWGNSLKSWTGATRAGGSLVTSTSTPSCCCCLQQPMMAYHSRWKVKVKPDPDVIKELVSALLGICPDLNIHTPNLRMSHKHFLCFSLSCSHEYVQASVWVEAAPGQTACHRLIRSRKWCDGLGEVNFLSPVKIVTVNVARQREVGGVNPKDPLISEHQRGSFFPPSTCFSRFLPHSVTDSWRSCVLLIN